MKKLSLLFLLIIKPGYAIPTHQPTYTITTNSAFISDQAMECFSLINSSKNNAGQLTHEEVIKKLEELYKKYCEQHSITNKKVLKKIYISKVFELLQELQKQKNKREIRAHLITPK